jgi:lysozyme
MLQNDIEDKQKRLEQFPWYVGLDEVRRAAITNMAFNLGVSGLLRFPHMIAALAVQDWATANSEMLNSAWSRQVGDRANRLALQILRGEWQ